VTGIVGNLLDSADVSPYGLKLTDERSESVSLNIFYSTSILIVIVLSPIKK